jgi:hypothetical protein
LRGELDHRDQYPHHDHLRIRTGGTGAHPQWVAPGVVTSPWAPARAWSWMLRVSPPTRPPGGCTSTLWQLPSQS